MAVAARRFMEAYHRDVRGSETAPECADDEVIVIKTTERKLREAEQTIMDIQNLNEVPDSLRQLSAAACFFQFFQGSILCYLASRQNDRKWSWYTFYPDTDSFEYPSPNKIASFNILWFAPVFIFMSGMEHLACHVFSDTYKFYIARHQNPFRWTEYTFSASLMRVMIAQLVGVKDVHLLMSIYVFAAITLQNGATHERINAKARADGLPQYWRPFFVSWIAHLMTWIIIFNYFAVTVRNQQEEPFLWAIVIIVFLLDGCFALLFTLQWCKIPPFDDYVAGEKMFIILSFTAKTLLAWISFAGIFE